MKDQTGPEFQRFRAAFPGACDGLYLNVADRGLLSTGVRDALATYLEACVRGETKELSRTAIDGARQSFARLVNADQSEIALTKNVSEGINAFANAVDWRPGDNVVVCEALEHPSNLFPWYNLRDRIGITVRSVEPTGWAIDPKSMIAAIDERTRLVTASIVTFAPGFRTDVIEIGEACRKSGALFLVDAAQAVGVLDIDLGTLPIDAMAVGTPKALLGLYGMGFLFVRAEIAERLRPSYMSGAGIKRGEPECSKVLLAPGAARFDLGNPNHIGCVAAATSIAELMRIGTAKIEAYTRQLAETLSQGLEKHGLPVMTPPDAQLRTNIVAVGKRLESTLESTSDGQLLGLAAHLKQNRVEFSVRRGVLRFSVHAYNAHHDIEKVIGLLGELRL